MTPPILSFRGRSFFVIPMALAEESRLLVNPEILRFAQDDKRCAQDDREGVQDDTPYLVIPLVSFLCHSEGVSRGISLFTKPEILRFAQDDKRCAQDDKRCAQDDRRGAQDDKRCAQDDRGAFGMTGGVFRMTPPILSFRWRTLFVIPRTFLFCHSDGFSRGISLFTNFLINRSRLNS